MVEDNPDDVALTERALKKARIANKLVVAKDGPEASGFPLRDRRRWWA